MLKRIKKLEENKRNAVNYNKLNEKCITAGEN